MTPNPRDVPRLPELSVVVPVLNEEPNVPLLVEAIRDALGHGFEWELVLVDDGSTDATLQRILEASRADARIRCVPLARNYGQSTAMQAGFDHARGNVMVTMDGDLQNDPRDIPILVDKLDEGYDLVAGYRLRRKDRFVTRRIPSWFANRLMMALIGVSIRDSGCSLKAYRRELLDHMRLYSDMHRFIPALAVGVSGARIAEVEVRHHPRRYGTSKYGLSRVVKVAADLVTIKVIRSFRSRPLKLAGSAAFLSALAALVFGGSALADRLRDAPGEGEIVFPSASVVLAALAVFLILVGLVAEAVVLEHDREVRETCILVHEAS